MEKLNRDTDLDDDIQELLQDDVENRIKELHHKKENRKLRYRKLKRSILLVLLVGSIWYFMSDASKVKSLSVSGNSFYSSDEVYKIAGLSYESRYIVLPSFYLQWKLEQDPFIQSAEVHKQLDGAIHIEIKDEPILGYIIEDSQTLALLADGKKLEIPSEQLMSIANYALLGNFSDEQLTKILDGFYHGDNAVDPLIISMISEIQPYQTSYDSNMVKITMRDGNVLFGPYNSVRLLNYYKQTMSTLNTHPACLSMDYLTSSIVSMECPAN